MFLKTFFVHNWRSNEGQKFRHEAYTKLTDQVLQLLTMCETTKIQLSYSELLSMSYPDFIYTSRYIASEYRKIAEAVEKQAQSLENH